MASKGRSTGYWTWRAHKIDLARLSTAALIDAFAASMEAALAHRDGGPMQLARWATWLVMAATLTQLRSQLLLPLVMQKRLSTWSRG